MERFTLEVIVSEECGKCHICGNETNYIHVDFWCYVCSITCLEKLDKLYYCYDCEECILECGNAEDIKKNRNPERIERILKKMEILWKQNPDLRLCQLVFIVSNLSNGKEDIFYTEDDEFEKAMDECKIKSYPSL